MKVLKFGEEIQTLGQVRDLIAHLSDNDIVVVEACDKNGDVEDLYPMSIDVIEGIRLADGSIVNEVRFCQRPNKPIAKKPINTQPIALTPEMADKALALINNIDWAELKKQKQALNAIVQYSQSHIQLLAKDLEGIVSLLDAIQDFAVDEIGIDENVVFDTDECTTDKQSIWTEIRNDFQTDEFVHIDGWINDETGATIAKVNVQTKEVIYLDERAKTDYLAQEAISDAISNLKD